MRYSVGSNLKRSSFDSPTLNYVIYQISSHLVHKQGHYGNIFKFWQIWKKVWGRVINPLWCLKAPSPATKKWIFEFCTKFGFRNHLQTFWPRRLVKSELSLGLLRIQNESTFGKPNKTRKSLSQLISHPAFIQSDIIINFVHTVS